MAAAPPRRRTGQLWVIAEASSPAIDRTLASASVLAGLIRPSATADFSASFCPNIGFAFGGFIGDTRPRPLDLGLGQTLLPRRSPSDSRPTPSSASAFSFLLLSRLPAIRSWRRAKTSGHLGQGHPPHQQEQSGEGDASQTSWGENPAGSNCGIWALLDGVSPSGRAIEPSMRSERNEQQDHRDDEADEAGGFDQRRRPSAEP